MEEEVKASDPRVQPNGEVGKCGEKHAGNGGGNAIIPLVPKIVSIRSRGREQQQAGVRLF